MKFDANATATRLTTANVSCTHDEGGIFTLTHKDYPFTCVVSEWMLTRKGTNKIRISNESDKAVREKFGLLHTLFKSAQGYAETYAKYHMGNKPTEPNHANLATIEGKRLEAWYTKWFSYLNEVEYLPLIMKCSEMVNSSNGAREYADKVLGLTTETKERAKDQYGSKENSITLKNKFAVMTISETSDKASGRLEIEDWNMTPEQRLKLFIFLDGMSKEDK